MTFVERVRPGVRVETDNGTVRFVSLDAVTSFRGTASVRLWESLADSLTRGSMPLS